MLEFKAQQTKSINEAQSPAIRLAQDPRDAIIPIKAGFTQFEVINAIYDSKILSEVKLTAGARLVLISLARHYNPSNDEFFPSYTCIASHTGVSKKSVERAIKELVGAGLITYRTEKVNRYRFTGRFFASVNLSVPQRQNDGCNQRQNDEQTNNHEKRKNNKNVLNFSSKRGGSREVECSVDKEITTTDCAEESPLSLKDFGVEKNCPPARQNDVGGGANPSRGGDFACVSEPRVSAYANQQTGKNSYYSRFSTGAYAKNRTGAAYKEAQFAQKGGSSFTPSVSTTNEYLQNVRQSRSEACSPIDFDYETAKRWYSSLNEVLRQSTLAKKVAQKFGF